MEAEIKRRLTELRSEFESGRRMLADLDARRTELQQTLLRIEGAMQVLEEMLGTPTAAGGQDGDGASPGPGEGTADRAWSVPEPAAANG